MQNLFTFTAGLGAQFISVYAWICTGFVFGRDFVNT